MEQTPNIPFGSGPLWGNLWPPSDLHCFVNHVENTPKVLPSADSRIPSSYPTHRRTSPPLNINAAEEELAGSASELRPPSRLAKGTLTKGVMKLGYKHDNAIIIITYILKFDVGLFFQCALFLLFLFTSWIYENSFPCYSFLFFCFFLHCLFYERNS